MVSIQQEIVELQKIAKNCKLSAEEARRIKGEIASVRGHISSCSEQRSEVAKLVEKREMQLANISADVDEIFEFYYPGLLLIYFDF